jgi:tRNA-dihydrouridine synthase B
MQATPDQVLQQDPQAEAQPIFRVGKIPVYGDAILAPMDGFSDWPFRSICRRLGSAMSYNEFTRAEFILGGFEHIANRFYHEPFETPFVIQLYGDDPDLIIAAARKVMVKEPDIIDINMGCPARTVANRGAGVGLMRTPLKVAHIFQVLSRSLPVPVTGKIRLGWDDNRTYKLIARIVEENGGALVAVHGRTQEQGYGGEANWDAIAEVKASVGIPVIGNGDVRRAADIKRMKEYTGCEAVMIGRAAIGNPWIFAGLDREQVTPGMIRQMVREHLQHSMTFYGEHKGLVLFRKHASRYLALQRLPRAMRTRIILQKDAESFLAGLDQAIELLQ